MGNKEIAVIAKEIVSAVTDRVGQMVEDKQITFPDGYDWHTAIQSAGLQLQDTKDKNGRPVLEVCTRATASKALLDMTVQGLQPVKKQCYFIAYADQLTLFRSYFGTVCALKRAMPEVKKVVCEVIYEGDEVFYETSDFGETFIHHKVTSLMNANNPIVGGWCNIFNGNGDLLGYSVMTWEQIQTSWRQSRSFKAEGGVHQKFSEDMCKRTLISKACKFLLNTSLEISTNNIVVKAFNDTTDADYDFEEQKEQKPEAKKVTFKEKYGIGKEAEAKQNETAKAEDPAPSEEAKGPEDFDDEIPWPTDEEMESQNVGELF